MYRVMFIPWGQTYVSKDGKQVPELQVPWFEIFVKWLVEQGVDLKEVEFTLPSGQMAELVHTVYPVDEEEHFNWRVKRLGQYVWDRYGD